MRVCTRSCAQRSQYLAISCADAVGTTCDTLHEQYAYLQIHHTQNDVTLSLHLFNAHYTHTQHTYIHTYIHA